MTDRTTETETTPDGASDGAEPGAERAAACGTDRPVDTEGEDRSPPAAHDDGAASAPSTSTGRLTASAGRPTSLTRGGAGHLQRLTYAVAVAAAFGLGSLSDELGVAGGAALLVGLGVALALAASASLQATAVVAGSLGALASGMLTAASPALAGGVLVGLCFAERTARVPGTAAKLVHLLLAVAGGAVAGLVCATYETAEPGIRAIAVVVAAVLAAMPLFVDADDPRAHALEGLAEQVPAPAQGLLRRGAALCRTVDEAVLDRELLGQVRRSWRKLLELGEARARLSRAASTDSLLVPATNGVRQHGAQARAVARRLDEQIAGHVEALTRAYTAVDAAQAAELALDDSALRSVQCSGESLEHVAEAIVDEV